MEVSHFFNLIVIAVEKIGFNFCTADMKLLFLIEFLPNDVHGSFRVSQPEVSE